MKAVVTGQVGLDKKPYLQQVVHIAAKAGHSVHLANVGDIMYTEAPDVAGGRILDLPLTRLRDLRRTAFKDVLAVTSAHDHLIVNTHATFRWRHGLFYAFDYDHMKALDADYYICLVDNIDAIHHRLLRDNHTNHNLKDLMVWREEEVLATELLSQIVRGHRCFYIQARGQDGGTAEALYRLLLCPHMRKAYLSFPMSHVTGQPAIMAEIETFRREMKRHFVCFDPGDLEEKHLCQLALQAVEQGCRKVTVKVEGQPLEIDAQELVSIIGDIDGQIYARDFKLIDQSDMIISFVPELSGGTAVLSSGVERELQHAHEAAKDVFVVWRPAATPSPFV
ncbi:MAG: AAA family ATPase, partial [Planctomycetes bacterium]|nr:AAA family ATPase [Planctomycetota bacterium]